MTHDEHHWWFHHHKHHPETPTPIPVAPHLNESEPTMAVFDAVSVALDGKHLTLSGNATLEVDSPFEGTAVVKANDGSTQNFAFSGTRAVVTDDGGAFESVSDNLGGVWTIEADGRSADGS